MNIDKSKLSNALSQCGKAVKNRSTIPILDCVMLEAVNGTFTLRTSNPDVWIERRVECDGDLKACCLNFHKFSQLIGLSASETVSLEMKGQRLALKHGAVVNVLAITKASEFPPFPKAGSHVAVPTDCLADGIAAVDWLPNQEHPTDVMNAMKANVVVELSLKSLDCLSYTGVVMAHFGRGIIYTDSNRVFLIPYAFAPFLVPVLREPNAAVSATDNAISVRSDSGSVSVKLAEGKCGPWREYIDSMKGATTTFEVAPLMLAAQRAQVIFRGDDYPKLTMELTGDTLVIESQCGDTTSERIPFVSEPGWISLNARYLANTLKRLDAASAQCVIADTGSNWRAGDLEIMIAHWDKKTHQASAPEPEQAQEGSPEATQPALI